MKVDPVPGWLATSISPPRRWARERDTDSPSPLPSCSRVVEPSTWRNLSKRVGRAAAGIPIPVSRTAKSIPASDSLTVKVTRP